MGREPVSGRPYADFVKDNASAWQEAWRRNFGDNAVIRTSDCWDGTVKHLGYTSVSVQWYVRDTLSRAITTDEDLVKASQERLREVEVIPDDRLTPRQLAHLRLARIIADRVCRIKPVSGVHAAIIPPASDRVRTAGMYSRTTREVYIASHQLERGQSTVDTVIHELAHHTSGAEDLDEAHSAAMTRIAARVVELAAKGEFDDLIKEEVANFTW
jgi:23S rRNA U2552 (ribose-2'-O)-methylase RlmE/FtsJ